MRNGSAFNQVKKAFSFKFDSFLRGFQNEEKIECWECSENCF